MSKILPAVVEDRGDNPPDREIPAFAEHLLHPRTFVVDDSEGRSDSEEYVRERSQERVLRREHDSDTGRGCSRCSAEPAPSPLSGEWHPVDGSLATDGPDRDFGGNLWGFCEGFCFSSATAMGCDRPCDIDPGIADEGMRESERAMRQVTISA